MAVVMVGAAVVRLRRVEPSEVDALALTLGAFFVLYTVGIGVVSIWQRRVWVTLIPIAGLVLFVGAEKYAEDIHWHLSRHEFAGVLEGGDVSCDTYDDCRVGWWRSTGTQRLDSMVVVWVPDVACYAGLGLVHPLGGDPGAEAIREAAVAADFNSDIISVSPWRDGWYRMCLTT